MTVTRARHDSISSFDGTRIVLSFFPADGLKAGQRASTPLTRVVKRAR
jgi:hypothetical protein